VIYFVGTAGIRIFSAVVCDGATS